MGLSRALPGRQRIWPGCWARLTTPEYAYKEFDAPPVRLLNVPCGPDDE